MWQVRWSSDEGTFMVVKSTEHVGGSLQLGRPGEVMQRMRFVNSGRKSTVEVHWSWDYLQMGEMMQ